MKRKRFTEVQIIEILNEHEAGMSVEEFVRRHGIGASTLYKKHGGRVNFQVRLCAKNK